MNDLKERLLHLGLEEAQSDKAMQIVYEWLEKYHPTLAMLSRHTAFIEVRRTLNKESKLINRR